MQNFFFFFSYCSSQAIIDFLRIFVLQFTVFIFILYQMLTRKIMKTGHWLIGSSKIEGFLEMEVGWCCFGSRNFTLIFNNSFSLY